MEQYKNVVHEAKNMSFDEEISQLSREKILFANDEYVRLPMGIEIYDAKGFLHTINDAALKIYGVNDRNTVIGIVNLFNSPYVDDKLETRIKSGDDITLEFEYDFDRIKEKAYFESHNQATIIYEVKIVPMRNKAQNIIGHILITNDVTSAKEVEFHTEENKKNLEMAMEAANMSSWVYDTHKKIFNPLYGDPISKKNMTLDKMLDKLHPQDRTQVVDIFSRLINKEIEYGHITVRHYVEEEKQYHYLESRMRLSSEQFGKLLIIGTEMDVTEKIRTNKKAEDLAAKRELAMKVSGIVHWDYDVHTNMFESYNDPINDYANEKLVTVTQFMDVLHPEDYSVFNDFIQSLKLADDHTSNFTCRIRTKHDDNWQYCNMVSIPFEKDEQGNIIRYTGFRQNISKTHQLNEELRERSYKMDLTFRTIGMSYWDFDVTTGLFKAFNESANDFNPDNLLTPEAFLKTTHPEDMDEVKKYIDHMIQGVDKDFTFKYRSMNKWDQDWQSFVITGIQSEKNKKGKVIRYTGIRFNNTKWEKIAQELKELKEKAELSDRLKSAFLANMSHEIRTPLNAIIGFSELMVNCEDENEKAEYMEIIQSNNELLLRLVNDILDLSKIESGILERKREKFNLLKVCNELYTMIQPKITNPDVDFLMSPGPECRILLDRNRLKQVWMNYLTNAIKCTKSGHIRMGYTLENGGIRIFVEDTGVGIPLELQDRVFGRFQKLNEFAQGTGLGLAISRAIIEAAGGEVGFTSTPGVGTTFWAWIPCAVEQQELISLEEDNEPSDKQTFKSRVNKNDMKILIAEDNDSNYLLVQQILKDYNISRVENGAEAVNAVRDGDYDFVLMDMKMPIMGGLEAVRKIREFDKDIEIIALTANAFDSDRINALEAGCNEFLTKPLKKSQLLGLF